MLSAVNKDATVVFTYDKAGRLLSETLTPLGGAGGATTYAYDIAAGKRTLTYPSGMKVVEQLNARDLITSILQNSEEVVTMAYNAAGQKTTQGYANGITTTYGYNENGWLSSIVVDHDIMNLQMTYDPIGNMTERKDMLDNTRTESYGYDVINQLTSFKRGTTVDKSYQFDLLGNRIRTLENGIATNYMSNNVNAYTSITGGLSFTPQYDDNGNMLNDDKHTYAYDFNNKLISVDQTVGTYKYDALGRRIAKNNTIFYYVGDQMVEEATDGVTTSYLYGNNIDEALQMKRGDDVYYYHTNHIGSILSLSNGNSVIVEKVNYDAYGLPVFFDVDGNILAQSSIDNNILFTGREFNMESGNYYYRARIMHPLVGQFVQKDPLGYIDGMNDYNYVNNLPTFLSDAYGLTENTERIYIVGDASGHIGNMMTSSLPASNTVFSLGGPTRLGNYNWGSNGKVYGPNFHGNQYVKIQGNLGNVGSMLGIASTALKAPDYYDKMVNSNSWGEWGRHLGDFSGQALGGIAGAEAGAYLGATIGAGIGVWFGGVGAAPGAAIGGVIGGLIGGLIGGIGGAWGGGKAGRWTGEKLGGHFDPHSDCDKNTPKINWPKIPKYPLGDFEYSPGPNPFPNSRIVIV